MKTKTAKDPYKVICGERLRQAREALGHKTARAFAGFTGVTEDALYAYESGARLVSPRYVKRLKTRYGITFEWIYDGSMVGLPSELLGKLELASKEQRP